MKKILLSALALLMAVSMMAMGDNSGKGELNAIDFEWDSVYECDDEGFTWFSIDLTKLSADDPALSLYLTNRNSAAVNATLNLKTTVKFFTPSIPGVEAREFEQKVNETFNYSIDANSHQIWSFTSFPITNPFTDEKDTLSLRQVLELGMIKDNKVKISILCDQNVLVSAEEYEISEIIEDACTEAVDFDWSDDDGVAVATGETWFYLDLLTVKSSNQKLDFVVKNDGEQEANVSFDLALNCPVSVLAKEYDWTIPVGGSMTDALGRVLLDQLSGDFAYLKLTTDQPLTLTVKEQDLPDNPAVLFDATGAPTLQLGEANLIDGEKIFVLDLNTLKAPNASKTVCTIVNNTNEDIVLDQAIAFTNPVTENNVELKSLLVPANTTKKIDISNKTFEAIKSDVAYLQLKTAKPLTLTMEHVLINPNATPIIYAPTCEESYKFDWNSPIKQTAFATKWYTFDISDLKKKEEHIQLSFTNSTDYWMIALCSILPDCDSKDTTFIPVPIPAGKVIDQVIDYSLIAANTIEPNVLMSVTVLPTSIKSLKELDPDAIQSTNDLMDYVSADFKAYVQLTAKKIPALVDPTACKEAVTFERGVEYHQEAGTTKWYRITDELLTQFNISPDVTFVNNGDKAANVTLGATVDCNYGIVTKGTITIPTWFDLTMYIPPFMGNIVNKIVDEDITEFYVEVTTDQPIMFGLDIDYGFALGCNEATEFDWNSGAMIKPRDIQWFKFNTAELKANELQTKLTFTNHSDSLAWVAALVTLECPFNIGMPLAFPVPAGKSVDKWIDYSYIASSKLDEMYVAIYTDCDIELHAETETAVITPVEGCRNATLVEPNVLYTVQPGTSWYNFQFDTFLNTDDEYAYVRFANIGDKRATVTAGATVGCEYGILTRAKTWVPTMDVDANVPTWVFKAMNKLISNDVNQYLVQVTTNEPLQFEIRLDVKKETVYTYDTIYTYACDGGEFNHPLTGETLLLHGEAFSVNDTVETAAYEYLVTTYVVAPFVEPQEIDAEILATILGVEAILLEPGMPKAKVLELLDEDPVKKYYEENAGDSIAAIVALDWYTSSVACGAEKHVVTLEVETECEELHEYKIELPVKQVVKHQPDAATICYGEPFTWNGQSCTESKEYTHEVKNAYDCVVEIYTLNLTILPEVEDVVETATICYGETYEWALNNNQSYNATDEYSVTLQDANGCDYTATLKLTVLPEVKIPDVSAGIKVLCGEAINITEAETMIKEYAAADQLFPTIESIVWEKKPAVGDWAALTTDAIDGNETHVSVRYTINTTCEEFTDEFLLEVEKPTYENNPEEMAIIPVYHDYGARLLYVDLVYIRENFEWVVNADDVEWFILRGSEYESLNRFGYYLTNADGAPFEAGTYVARISHTRVDASDCDGELQTLPATIQATAQAPKLAPTVAQPQELIRVLNLNPETVTSISVYSTTGELIESFQVANQADAYLKAAHMAGYYVVEVQPETEKVSLRYIVK